MKQHIDCVERAVMRALRQSFPPGPVEIPSDDASYAKFEFDVTSYNDAASFKHSYLIANFLRKWKGLLTGINLEKAALSAWKGAEFDCFRTNSRLEREASTGFYSVAPSIISDAQRKIALVLGHFNPELIAKLCRFGNGATYDLRRGSTHAEKMRKPSVTIDALPLACQVLSGDIYMQELVGGFSDLKIVDCNRMVMVPKSSKTHRPIAAEPTLNSFIQQGFGRYIRMRLKRFGVDLDNQTINQSLAFSALVDGLSTIDLSSASDTLCINLVKLLLPREWFEMLSSLRCSKTEYGGRKYLLSKFSSMGNAFTFELESLIFWSLCSSVCSDHDVVSVYGDDIVVPWHRHQDVLKVLGWAGFRVNPDKSFGEGSRFFESCGKHYFDLEDVTPCFQKDICSRPVDFIRLHNRLVRAGLRLGLSKELSIPTRIVRDWYRSSFPRAKLVMGPVVEYDEYFIDVSFNWPSPRVDRIRLGSWVEVTRVSPCLDDLRNKAYLGRKLRLPAFLNPSLNGSCSETRGHTTVFRHRWHWRSSALS